jgi:hypothetical protein
MPNKEDRDKQDFITKEYEFLPPPVFSFSISLIPRVEMRVSASN